MPKQFSLYLDLARFMAAFFVLLSHYIQHDIVSGNVAFFLPDLGRESVIVFFVLSGYVIAYTTSIKKLTVKQYLIARSARIYSVAMPMLLIAFIVAFIVENYCGVNAIMNYQIARAYFYIPFHFLFLGELWRISETPPWLAAYWSLGYEVWYYLFFGIIYFFKGWQRYLFGIMILLIMGYKLWLLLPVWLSGVILFKYQNIYGLSQGRAKLGWLTSVGLLIGYKYFNYDVVLRMLGNELWPFTNFRLGSADRYLCDYFVCFIVLSNFYFARHINFVSIQSYSVLIKQISSYTFTLYLGHTLIISLFKYFLMGISQSLFDVIVITFYIFIFTYLFGNITERKKEVFSRLFELLYDYVSYFFGVIVRKKT